MRIKVILVKVPAGSISLCVVKYKVTSVIHRETNRFAVILSGKNARCGALGDRPLDAYETSRNIDVMLTADRVKPRS